MNNIAHAAGRPHYHASAHDIADKVRITQSTGKLSEVGEVSPRALSRALVGNSLRQAYPKHRSLPSDVAEEGSDSGKFGQHNDLAHTDSGYALRAISAHPHAAVGYSSTEFEKKSLTVPKDFLFSVVVPALWQQISDTTLLEKIKVNARKKYRNTLGLGTTDSALNRKYQSQFDKGQLRVSIPFLIQEALTHKYFFRAKNVPASYQQALTRKVEQVLRARGVITLVIPMMTRKPSGNSPIKCRSPLADLGDAVTVMRMSQLARIINNLIDEHNLLLRQARQAESALLPHFKVKMIADINRYHGIFKTPEAHVERFQSDIERLANMLSPDVDVVRYDSVADEIRQFHPDKYMAYQRIYAQKLSLHKETVLPALCAISDGPLKPFSQYLSMVTDRDAHLATLAASMLFSINFDSVEALLPRVGAPAADVKDLLIRASVDPALLSRDDCANKIVADGLKNEMCKAVRAVQRETLLAACTYKAAYQANSQTEGIDDITVYMGSDQYLRGGIHKKNLASFDARNMQVTVDPSPERLGIVSWHSSAWLKPDKDGALYPKLGLACQLEASQMIPIVEQGSGRVVCFVNEGVAGDIDNDPEGVFNRLRINYKR